MRPKRSGSIKTTVSPRDGWVAGGLRNAGGVAASARQGWGVRCETISIRGIKTTNVIFMPLAGLKFRLKFAIMPAMCAKEIQHVFRQGR